MSPNRLNLALLFTVIISFVSAGQIGIGTTNPDPSSLMDISSNTQGLLVPRMTTAQRNAIQNPAQGLLVYDTTLNDFFFHSGTKWELSLSQKKERDNFVLVKTQSDLPAPSGGVITLDKNTYYEINGTINLTKSINLNDAYISGRDAPEDVLLYPGGTIFKGNKGGAVRNLTLTGAKAFDIEGPGISSNSSLLLQNTMIAGMTSSVGTISRIGLFFGNIVQFIGNNDGITYSDIGNLLLNNQAWLGNNAGTYEKLENNFGLVEKVSGFSTVSSGATGFDVSANPTVADGVLLSTVFSGTGTYVKRYTTGSYDGYNFTNLWSINCPGIPRENDDVATGDINFSNAVGSGAPTIFSGTGTSSRKKIEGSTTSNSLFRFARVGDNKLKYKGETTRFFQVTASVSYQSSSDMTLILYIAKNGNVIEETKVYGRGASGYFVNGGILALPIVGTLELKKDDYIEIWGERYSGNGYISTVSLNLTVR